MDTSYLWSYWLAAVIILLILIRLKDYIRSCMLAFFLEGPPASPILGNAQLLSSKRVMNFLETPTKYCPTNTPRLWLSLIPIIYLTEPKHIQAILGSSRNSEKNMLYSALHNFLGRGLITNNGYKWKSHRKLIQPYFNINILSQFVDTFYKGANLLVDTMKNETCVNIAPLVNECILNILQEGVLGVPMEDFDPDSPFRKGKVYLSDRFAKPWLLMETIFKLTSAANSEYKQKSSLFDYTKQILINRRRERKNGAPPKISLMDFFIEISEENSNFTDDDIIQEICTFMLAGQDSVGAATAFALYCLAKHPEVQKKVIEEQRSINSTSTVPTFDDLNKMVYLEQCVNETLRMFPSVPVIARVVTEDVDLNDFILPKGTNLFLSPLATHKLPHIYTDPRKFDPDRFSPENVKKLHPFAFIPFSAGPRNCLGYKYAYIEIKTILSTVLKNYHLSLSPEHEDLDVYYRITLRAKGGIWVNLKRKNQETTS